MNRCGWIKQHRFRELVFCRSRSSDIHGQVGTFGVRVAGDLGEGCGSESDEQGVVGEDHADARTSLD